MPPLPCVSYTHADDLVPHCSLHESVHRLPSLIEALPRGGVTDPFRWSRCPSVPRLSRSIQPWHQHRS